MTPADVLRWATTIAAVGALTALAYSLGVTAGPVVASAVVLAVSGALAVALWRRELDAREVRAAAAKVAVRTDADPGY